MLSLEDCIAFSGLTAEQLDAVACHEHLPLIVVAEWAETVLAAEDGCAKVAAILAEEVEAAVIHHKDRLGDWAHGLEEFLREHAVH
ncbi:hypothetical protein [Paramagnetospirillum magneticum]|uniref:Uncharacterized protein n=1 Tax=Paramagnetospirillum magneticum (strain ATCC 700264 / AMB-1) TaxID=342108 RepID=Q2W373_PARM1|nr:hypothetical protein [Paramagnetospirillum magneticum]BAE51702.1 hypothetical protein amb2898 [Paramagnetospirillum magneticum AMB-1]